MRDSIIVKYKDGKNGFGLKSTSVISNDGILYLETVAKIFVIVSLLSTPKPSC